MPSSGDPGLYNWNTNRLFDKDYYNAPRYPGKYDGGPPSYYTEGFLSIQNAIAAAFIERLNGSHSLPDIKVKRFPYPSYKEQKQMYLLQFIVPLFVLLSFNYSFSNAVRCVAGMYLFGLYLFVFTCIYLDWYRYVSVEKEKQLREAMKIMGLPSWLHWLSWFVRTMVMLTISVLLIIVLLKIHWFHSPTAILPNSNFLLLGSFFVTYCVCLTTFSFLLSVFFSKAKSAVTASTIVW